tara:strand:- start:1622 stop:9025 length:7404 start_codon:yes stop_codon:yes gene_type:complete
MTELEEIIQKMMDAGESEEDIKLVIENYESATKESVDAEVGPVKEKAVTTEPAPVTAENKAVDTESASEDISLEQFELMEPAEKRKLNYGDAQRLIRERDRKEKGGIDSFDVSSNDYSKISEEEKLKLQDIARKDLENKYKEEGVLDFNITSDEINKGAEKLLKEKTQPGLLESFAAQTARGFASTLVGYNSSIEMLKLGVSELALTAFDDDYKGTQEERDALYAVNKAYSGSNNLSLAANKFISDLEPSIRQYESDSMVDDIANGDFLQAGERAVGAALESLPSIVAASTGGGGIVALALSTAGSKFEEERKKDSSQGTGNLISNALMTGAIEAGFEVATRGVLKRAGILNSQGMKKAAKDLILGGNKEILKNFGINTLQESTSEMATEVTSIAADAIPRWLGGLDKEIDVSKEWKRVVEAGIVGSVFSTTATGVGAVKNRNVNAVEAAESILMPQDGKQAVIRSGNKISELFKDRVVADKEGIEILDKAIKVEIANIERIKRKNSQALGDMNPKEITAYASNNTKIGKLKSTINKPNQVESIKEIAEQDLKNLTEANNVLFEGSSDRRLRENIEIGSEATSRLGFKEKPKVFQTTEEYLSEVERLGFKRSEADGSEGVFVGKGVVLIDRERASRVGAVTVATHEVLHPVLNALVGDSSTQARIVSEFKKSMTGDQVNYVQGLLDENVEKENQDTEFITYFSDAIIKGDIKYEESVFKKIGNFLQRVFKTKGFKNIDFSKGEDVYKFIREYNRDVEKGKISDATIDKVKSGEAKSKVKVSEVGAIGSQQSSKSAEELSNDLEELIDVEFEMDEGDFESQKSNLELKIRQAKKKESTPAVTVKKPVVKKESSSKEKTTPKKVYNNESLIEVINSKESKPSEKSKAEADLVESFDNMALRAIKYDTRKGDYDRDEVKDYLREFLPRIVKSYKPGEAKFSTWVYNNIAPKAQQTYEKFKKIADKSLDAEAGGVGSVKEMSGDVNTLYGSEKASDLKESTKKMIKATSFGPITDPAKLKAVEEAVDLKDGERPNFKSLNSKNYDKVSEAIFGISGKKTRGNATLKYGKDGSSSEANALQNVFKNNEDVKKFIKTMPDYNVATKETVVNEDGENIDVSRDTYGRSIGINPKVLSIFYEKVDGAVPGISSPNGRSLGKTTQTDVYKLKPEFTGNISSASVTKLQSLIGINKGTLSIPIKGDARTEFGTVLTGLTKMYIDNVINTVGRSKLSTNQAKADLGAGKSSLMFSKNLELGLEASSNHNALLDVQFSKKKRAEYEGVLRKNRPELADIPKQVDNLFEWADGLDVPDNKKPKYKKLALYYTANGYTIFPEDGYKIEEVIRLSSINKIDPYAYKNPDELISKYTKEVKAKTINPDKVKEFFNKEEFEDGLVVYDVEDSKKGQRSVRSIVDSYWGTSANPWCLIARSKGETLEVFDTRSEAKEHSETLRDYWDTENTFTYDEAAGKWIVARLVDPKDLDVMKGAWTHWKQYNQDGEGEGYKIAFQNGKLLSFRDGGEVDPSGLDDDYAEYEAETKWWDRFDKPTDDLTIGLGKDKATGYKIIGSVDSEGSTAVTGYGEGDFMSKKSNYKLYNVDKNVVEAKTFKDGKISSSLTVLISKKSSSGKQTTNRTENKYVNGLLKSSTRVLKDNQSKLVLENIALTQQQLSNTLEVRETKETKIIDGYKRTQNKIELLESSGYQATTRTYYRETIIDGVSTVNLDNRAEMEAIKQSNIQFSKSIEKTAISNNNMLPKSQRLKGEFTNQEVLDRMKFLDDTQNKAELQFSKGLDLDKKFNDIIENKTGIPSYKEFSAIRASLKGEKKGRFNFFISPSAEDFVGLLYSTLGKGSVGDSQMKWYKDNLIDPYSMAVGNITKDRNNLGSDFKALKRKLKIVPSNLKKKAKGSDFTKEQAVRAYVWYQMGEDVPGLSNVELLELVDMVESDRKLTSFAQEIMKLNKGRPYVKPAEMWVTGTITTDLLESLNSTGRKQYLELWQQNVDIIFSSKNLNKLEAAFGKSYVVALGNILKRMKTGRNRAYGTDDITGRFTDWINGSTAAIMFFNTRSASLQVLSAVNFINFGDNNIIAAGKAFANQKQYWSDYVKLWNSEFLVERRDGLKININEEDIANIAKEKGVRGVINKLLKLGFTPTQLADSFAIASGGSTFYRNRIKSLEKGGMNSVAAERKAMLDFREIAEESQQSSRPDKISSQQAGPLGRIVLAFANTPAQYARIIKKAASDIKNGRGDLKTNLSKILYYGVAQNIIFNALQQALFAVSFGDEDEEEESVLEEKSVKIINGMIDGVARGTGIYGAVFTVVKNASIKLWEATQKQNPKYEDVALDLIKISPPISSKIQKLRSAGRTASWNMEKIKTKGFSLENPGFLAAGNVVSAATNVPLDRLVKKLDNLKAASDSEVEAYKRIALLAGWSSWQLGIDSIDRKKEKQKDKAKKTKSSRSVSNRGKGGKVKQRGKISR